jgi:hypothetical protein
MTAPTTPRRRSGRARTGSLPYTWRVGVDNEFGVLTGPDLGPGLLCEAIGFRGLHRGVVIDLATGDRRIVPADGTHTWTRMEPAAACERAGIAAPVVDSAAELERRVDPYHCERLLSPLWNALVDVIYSDGLLCGHPLRIAALNSNGIALRVATGPGWDGSFELTSREAPEKFACHVAERIARGESAKQAIRNDLADEAEFDAGELDVFLRTSGWQRVLDTLETRVARHAARLGRPAAAQVIALPTADPVAQLPLAA